MKNIMRNEKYTARKISHIKNISRIYIIGSRVLTFIDFGLQLAVLEILNTLSYFTESHIRLSKWGHVLFS